MKIIIRAAKIINPKSTYHNKVVDIKIDGETITEIGEKLEQTSDFQEIKLHNRVSFTFDNVN